MLFSSEFRKNGVQGVRILYGIHLYVFVNAADQPRKGLAGTAFDENIRTVRDHAFDRGLPAHGTLHLCGKAGDDIFGIRFAGKVGVYGNGGLVYRNLFQLQLLR